MKSGAKTSRHRAATSKALRRESGMTLIETMVAAIVLIVGLLALLGILATATAQNWNQGDRGTRTTEYAQDKIEQLLALSFADTTTNTAVYPPTLTGGTGLTPGGSVTPGTLVAGYVDYVDNTGQLQTAAAGDSYIRQWSIAVNAGGNLKTITVVASAVSSMGQRGAVPSTTLVSTKSLIQ